MKLSEARTTDEILAAAANFAWYETHKAVCPPDRIPTEADLCAWFDPEHPAWTQRCNDTLTQWAPVSFHGASAKRLCLVYYSGPAYRDVDISDLEELHSDWLAVPVDERQPHSLVGLVKAWQHRPSPVEPNRRRDRTMPARLGMVERADSRAGRLFTPAMHTTDGQLILPGFGTHVTMPTPALPLALYDLGIGDAVERRGHGAPLALRLWVESVLSVRMADRMRDRPVVMTVTLRDLLRRLYPSHRPSPARYWPRLMAAVEALEGPQARIPWEDPVTGKGGLRRVVSVSNIPRGPGALDDEVRLIVDLPPGAQDGPIVSPSLARWGVKAAAPYRALIGLAFRWWQPGVTRVPVGRGKHRHWVQTQDPARYGEPLNDREAIALCFPTSTRTERRKLAFEARRVLRLLVDAGEAQEVDGRLLPPAKGYGGK